MLLRILIFTATLSTLAMTTTIQGASIVNVPTKQVRTDQNDLSSILTTEALAQARTLKRCNEPSTVEAKKPITKSKCEDGGKNESHHGPHRHHGHDHHEHDHEHGSDRDQEGSHDPHEQGNGQGEVPIQVPSQMPGQDENQPGIETFTMTVPWTTSATQGVSPTTTGEPNSATRSKGVRSGTTIGLVAVVLAAHVV
ncbi:MAG: hypothetical protein J3Q66DRAFT_374107 [Benniella sp.]|nr:MAG: hypothetical protein J3Q66DRAFT_374107 [Benniella sp.]